MKRIIFSLAAMCWSLALTVHILSIARVDVREKFPFIWLLHVGIFIVWLPAILHIIKTNKQYKQPRLFDQTDQANFLKTIFIQTPKWITGIAILGAIYAIISFLFVMTSQQGTPTIKDGQFLLQSKGTLIRILTEQEYHLLRAKEARGFSGHWIAFYGIAAAILYPFNKTQKNISSLTNKT